MPTVWAARYLAMNGKRRLLQWRADPCLYARQRLGLNPTLVVRFSNRLSSDMEWTQGTSVKRG